MLHTYFAKAFYTLCLLPINEDAVSTVDLTDLGKALYLLNNDHVVCDSSGHALLKMTWNIPRFRKSDFSPLR